MELDLSALTNAEAKTLADTLIRAREKFALAHMPYHGFDQEILSLYGELRALQSEACREVNVRVAIGHPGRFLPSSPCASSRRAMPEPAIPDYALVALGADENRAGADG